MSVNRLFNHLKSSRGISIISIIIITALLYAGLNAYAYFNPDFQLNKISLVYQLRSYYDKQRIADLEKISAAIENYYRDNGEYPAGDGWCGRIVDITHPDVKNAIAGYFPNRGIPQDPAYSGTSQDFFYRREDRNSYVLLARLENLPAGSPIYNYEGCIEWPGDDVFNYQIGNYR